MTGELKDIYRAASKMDRYFDSATPCELFRGFPKGSKVALMTPTLIGFYKRKPDPKNPQAKIPDLTQGRHPDVLVTDPRTGRTPQYEGGTTKGLLLEEDHKTMEITAEIIKNADDYTPCRDATSPSCFCARSLSDRQAAAFVPGRAKALGENRK